MSNTEYYIKSSHIRNVNDIIFITAYIKMALHSSDRHQTDEDTAPLDVVDIKMNALLCQRLTAEHRKYAKLSVVRNMLHVHEDIHILVRDLKVCISVACHVVGIYRFGQRNSTKLNNIADTKLCSGYDVFLCHFCDHWIFERFAVSNGGVSLYKYSLFLAEVKQFKISVADVQEHLIDHRLYSAVRQQIFKAITQEVRYADHPDLASSLCIFKRTPDFLVFFEIT